MDQPRVSIIMPCYNGAETVERAIRGVINQTYRPIEFILVNDGSTDESHGKIKALEEEMRNSQIRFIYIEQENFGLGGAINTGLKHVTGKYLAWIDADDELLPKSVETRVDFLEKNLYYGSVSSNAYEVEDKNWDKPLRRVTEEVERNSQEDQFIYHLKALSIFCCGCHLLRTDVFRQANGGMDIYPSRYGQNWQMLLPVYYMSKHAFIDEPLYKYRVNADNMTAAIDRMPLKQLYTRRREYKKIIIHTLQRIPGLSRSEFNHYLRIFNKHINENNLDSAIEKGSWLAVFRWKVAVKLSILREKLDGITDIR